MAGERSDKWWWATGIGGAVGSAGSMLYAAQRVHAPLLLKVLFAGWVLAPFVLLALAHRTFKRARTTLRSVILVVAVVSVLLYASAAFGSGRPPTPLFVLTPPITALVVGVAILIAYSVSRSPKA